MLGRIRSAFGGIIGITVLAIAATHEPGTPPLGGAHLDGPSLGVIAEDFAEAGLDMPRRDEYPSDREWCLAEAEYWAQAGVEVPDTFECQGKPITYWRAQRAGEA
jgi:hypothetical protein